MSEPALTREQALEVLEDYLTTLQGHPAAEETLPRIVTEEPEGDQWRVAAQIVERFADLNDNAERLFAAPEEGLNT